MNFHRPQECSENSQPRGPAEDAVQHPGKAVWSLLVPLAAPCPLAAVETPHAGLGLPRDTGIRSQKLVAEHCRVAIPKAFGHPLVVSEAELPFAALAGTEKQWVVTAVWAGRAVRMDDRPAPGQDEVGKEAGGGS